MHIVKKIILVPALVALLEIVEYKIVKLHLQLCKINILLHVATLKSMLGLFKTKASFKKITYFLVEALCYKPEGRGFKSRWGGIFRPSSRTIALVSTQPLTEMSTRNLPGGKGRPVRKADNLTAICEPIV
jgi:hypothetical protein